LLRRRKTFKPPEATYQQEDMVEQSDGEEVKQVKPVRPPPIVGGLWTDDDFVELAKFCKKFPGGIPNRWEKIADCMNRTVPEVTHMAKKIVENLSR
jgi:DnaJ homolog subfamily C member 1